MADEEPGDDAVALAGLDVQWMRRFDWERLVRRCRLGFYEGKTRDPRRWVRHLTVQDVALVLATYGNLDGTRVRPSAARMAMVCDLDERTVRAVIGRLRRLNLLELVSPHRSPGRRGGPGWSAEYRLTAPADLLERVAHLDPEEQTLIVPPGVDTGPERKPRAPK
ncbi:hypothetical protein E1287_07235 [Actinomadura sp. KC06]|uniref:hypothetical protein n=1 Tax=Actinomadura sp. KC06 TaxID=2530369 RepID=UPI0010504D55|nr:hypothetical protein [Actinomadura sp. KC06]TDD37843.1 hypothetical protein E1287_07235 [Actinomadura sp. KC06]